MDSALKNLRETLVDGRGRFFRYRQRQLLAIHNGILANSAEVEAALSSDTGKAAFEAALEVALVLGQLQAAFTETDFDGLTEAAKKNKESGVLARPLGSVLIVGDWRSPLDSVISPLSSAIISGNVALSLVPAEAKQTLAVLQRILYPTLDAFAYPLIAASPSNVDQALSHPFNAYSLTSTDPALRLAVSSAASTVSHNAPTVILPHRLSLDGQPGQGQNVCLVSKTISPSSLGRVAQLVARAKFCALGGQGLGALSFVAVHEERHDQFVEELVKVGREMNAASSSDFATVATGAEGEGDKLDTLDGGKVVLGHPHTIVESVPVSSTLIAKQGKGRVLPVVPFTSTEEAIIIASARVAGGHLSVFASELEAAYFIAELPARSASVNDLPLSLLTGLSPSSSGSRWPSSLFASSIPVSSSKEEGDKSPVLRAPYANWQLEKMWTSLAKRKPLILRLRPHSNIIRRVFFLQGLFLSLSIVLGSIVTTGGYFALRRFF